MGQNNWGSYSFDKIKKTKKKQTNKQNMLYNNTTMQQKYVNEAMETKQNQINTHCSFIDSKNSQGMYDNKTLTPHEIPAHLTNSHKKPHLFK